MKHSLIAWKIVDVLRQSDDPRRASVKLANLVSQILGTDATHIFLSKRASLQDIASSGGSASSDAVEIARKCITTLDDQCAKNLFGTPLEVDGIPVGALVLDNSRPEDRAFLPVLRNLAGLLLMACGGTWQHLLDMQDFHAAVRQERQRSQRSARPFALLSISSKESKTLPPSAYTAVRNWVREVDVLGELDRQNTGVLLPDTDNEGARITATRVQRLLYEMLGLSTNVSFIVVPPNPAIVDDETVGEDEEDGVALSLEGMPWTSVSETSTAPS